MAQSSIAERIKGKIERIPGKMRRILYAIRNHYHHSGERVNPDFPDENFRNHFKVYELASQFVRDKDVLDCGSGTGYGSAYLAQQGARSVTGIDYSREAVAFARKRYSDKLLRFVEMDAQQMSLPDASFDFVFSSENLEHLPDPRANVSEIRRVLRPGGVALIATPNKEMFSPGGEPIIPYHIKELYFEELRDLLKGFFREVYIFENSLESPFDLGRQMKQQRVARGAVGLNPEPVPSATLGDHVVDLRHLHNTHSFLALMW
jgi:ubiquinone/menaquinone biosynthesis C-methylase UbiE